MQIAQCARVSTSLMILLCPGHRGFTLSGGREWIEFPGTAIHRTRQSGDQVSPKYLKQSQERNALPPEGSHSHRTCPRRYGRRGRAHDHFRKLGKPVSLWRDKQIRGCCKNQCHPAHSFLFKEEAQFQGPDSQFFPTRLP